MARLCTVIALVFASVAGSVGARAEPNWELAFDTMAQCVEQRDESCALQVAERVAVELPDLGIVKPTASGAPLAPAKLVMLADLSVFFAITGKVERAEHYLKLAERERLGEGVLTTNRPTNTARNFLLGAYMRAGNEVGLRANLDTLRDASGKPASLPLRRASLGSIVRKLRRPGQSFDERNGAKALSSWLSDHKANEPELVFWTGKIFANAGYQIVAERLAEQHDDDQLREWLAEYRAKKQTQSETEKRWAALLDAGDEEQIIQEIVEAANSRPGTFNTAIRLRLSAQIEKLAQAGKIDDALNLLRAFTKFAETISSRNCRIELQLVILDRALFLGAKELHAEVYARLPQKHGRTDIAARAKCGKNRLRFGPYSAMLSRALLMSKDDPAKHLEIPKDRKMRAGFVYDIIRITATRTPYLTSDQVVSLKAVQEKATNAERRDRAPASLAANAAIVRSYGYDEAAFRLLENAFRLADSKQVPTSQSARVKQVGQVVIVNRPVSRKQMVVLAIKALFGWRNFSGSIAARARIEGT